MTRRSPGVYAEWAVRPTLPGVTSLIPLLRTFGLSARLTRLVTTDVITQDVRERLIERLTYDAGQRAARREHAARVATAHRRGEDVPPPVKLPPPANPNLAKLRLKLVKLLTCRWCTGVWVAAAVVLLDRQVGHRRWWTSIQDAGLAAYAIGWLAEHEQD